jgi:LmbE family N-acetylglucosaminyl deacetylase
MTPPGAKTLLHRRTLPVGLGVLLAALFACSVRVPGATPPAPGSVSPGGPVFLQVVAHEDDDVLFMNPDVRNSVHSGAPTVTVFLTAGESDVSDADGYAAERQAGSRAAYARMAGVADSWVGEALVVGSKQVERYTLRARPQVQLIFVNLPEMNDPRAEGGKRALTRLWRDRAVRVSSLLPAGGVVHERYGYSHRDVVDLLVALLRLYRPTLLRFQDPAPDARYSRTWVPYHDHPDHVMAARFTGEAVRAYRSDSSPRLVLDGYRDYNAADAAVNLSPAEQRAKADLYAEYGKHDPHASFVDEFDAWPRRMYYRWPRGSTWATTDSRGHVQAFVVQSGSLLTWWQSGEGWAGPVNLGDAGGMLVGAVSVVRRDDGRLQVFARRDDDRIVTLAQGATGSWPADWESLDTPNYNEVDARQPELGAPVAVAGADGLLEVFVRDSTGGVSARWERSPGDWSDWAKLGGTDVQDGLAAARAPDGRLELFGATTTRLLHWRADRVGAHFAEDGTDIGVPPAGPPALASDGRSVHVFYPRAGSAQVACGYRDGRGWTSSAVPGAPGAGGVSAVWDGRRFQLFARNASGAAAMATEGGRGWSDVGGGYVVDAPLAVVDGSGAVVLLAESPDGRLLVNRRLPAGPFAGWQTAGS